MSVNTNIIGKINKALNDVFAVENQDDVRINTLAIESLRLPNTPITDEKILSTFHLPVDKSDPKTDLILSIARDLIQSKATAFISAIKDVDLTQDKELPRLVEDRLMQTQRKITEAEGSASRESPIIQIAVMENLLRSSLIQEVLIQGVPLSGIGILHAMALTALAKKEMPPNNIDEAIKKACRILNEKLLEKIPKCGLSGEPMRYPMYVNLPECMDGENPIQYFEKETLIKYVLLRKKAPNREVPCSLENLEPGVKLTAKHLVSVRKKVYEDIITSLYEDCSKELLQAAKIKSYEIDDFGFRNLEKQHKSHLKSLESFFQDKCLIEEDIREVAALFILAQPLYEKKVAEGVSEEESVRSSLSLAEDLLETRISHDPITGLYEDGVLLAPIKKPILVSSGRGGEYKRYYDQETVLNLANNEDPLNRQIIYSVTPDHILENKLNKRKNKLCTATIVRNGSILSRISKDSSLLQAIVNKIVPSPVTKEGFFEAVKNGDVKTLKRGIRQGFNDETTRDWNNNTACMIAAENGHLDAVEYLMSQPKTNVNAQNLEGRTAFMLAARSGQLPIIKYLMNQKEVDVHIKDKAGNSTFIQAADSGCLESVQFFVDQGVTPTDLNRAFLLAARSGRLNIMKYLLGKGVSVNATDETRNTKRTALMEAVSARHDNIIQFLLSQENIDINAQDDKGFTALMIAAENGRSDIYEPLINNKKIDFSIRNKNGRTALIQAIDYGRLDMLKDLIEKGAAINTKDNQGNTALMRAAAYGKLEAVRFLIAKGADVNIKDNKNQTALMLAERGDHSHIVEILL